MDYNAFLQIAMRNVGCAMIFAGSDSDDKPKGDKPSHIEQIAVGLEQYEIPYWVTIASGHKQPEKIMGIIRSLNSLEGAVAFIAVAGGTDALSGILAYHAHHPVISCPPDAPNQSCLSNPPGSSNLYIARPGDVGKAVAQMYACLNPRYQALLNQFSNQKITSLETNGERIVEKYAARQEGR